MSASQIRELRKAGKLDEALAMAQSELDASPDNIWAKRNIGWVFYGYISSCEVISQLPMFMNNIKAVENLQLPSGEEMLFDSLAWKIGKMIYVIGREEIIDVAAIKSLVRSIVGFSFSRPSESYSFLLKAIHKVLKNTEAYNDFVDWWDLNNLRPEDFLSEKLPNGKDAMSLAEMVYSGYTKNLLPKSNYNQGSHFNKSKAIAFLPLLTVVDEQNPNFQYVSYYRAKLLLALGDRDNTLSAFLPFARRKKRDFWVWDLLAEVVNTDPEKMLACYCKGLSCKNPKEMLTNLRIRLCRILISKDLYNEAKTEINEIVRVRTENGYNISSEILNWQQSVWYNTAIAMDSNNRYYRQHFMLAESVLYADVDEEKVIIERVDLERTTLNYFTAEKRAGYFKYGKAIKNIKAGDVLEVRFKPSDGTRSEQIYTIRLSLDLDFRSRFVKRIKGEIKIPENKNFGFLDDVFVHPSLISSRGLKGGTEIDGEAIRAYDLSKDKWGWKLL
jgi:hypothetical protein